jgi:hypothetical protein
MEKTPPVQRAASRKKLAVAGQALPSGSFPVPNVDYLKRAIRSVGRCPSAKRPALKALILKRAKGLGATQAPGVKGTWAFQGAGDTESVDLATAQKLMTVRRGTDLQITRTGPKALNVTHKPTGTKIGSLISDGTAWSGMHTPSGKKIPAAPSVSGALTGLIACHNQMASKKLPPAQKDGTAVYANGQGDAVDLAGALPVSTGASMDGPRVTSMGGGKKAVSKAAVKLKMDPGTAVVYARLRKKGMGHGQALGLAKRAVAMKAKAA